MSLSKEENEAIPDILEVLWSTKCSIYDIYGVKVVNSGLYAWGSGSVLAEGVFEHPFATLIPTPYNPTLNVRFSSRNVLNS